MRGGSHPTCHNVVKATGASHVEHNRPNSYVYKIARRYVSCERIVFLELKIVVVCHVIPVNALLAKHKTLVIAIVARPHLHDYIMMAIIDRPVARTHAHGDR